MINLEEKPSELMGVEVDFEDGYRVYSFKAFKSLELQQGDTVVVKTQHGMKVARVVGVHPKPGNSATKYVIDKVNVHEHFLERELVNKQNTIKKKIKTHVKNRVDENMVEMMLPNDDKLQELVAQLEELNGGKY